MDIQKSSYRQQYLVEAREILDSVGEAVLRAESDPTNADLLNSIFRGVHTIKGSSAMFDMDSLGGFAHHLEGLLNVLRSGEAALTPDVADVILKGLDALGEMLDAIVRGEEPEVRHDLVACFKGLAGGPDQANPADRASPTKLIKPANPAGSAELADPTGSADPSKRRAARAAASIVRADREVLEAARAAVQASGGASLKLFFVELRYASEHLANGFDPAVFLRSLKASCSFYRAECADETPGRRGLRPLDLHLRPSIVVATDLDAAGIRDLAFDEALVEATEIAPHDVPAEDVADALLSEEVPEDVPERKALGQILIEEKKITEADLDQALAKQASGRAADPCATAELKVMRVDETKIDGFSNMIGELVIARNAYDFLVNGLEAGNGLDASGMKALKDNLRLFSRITGELQRGVMTLRMVPIRSVFQKYSRVVRDISRRQGKLIDFRIEGGETEVDKKVADLLSEPLIHMIRNSCDHGLETPEERIAAGKPELGSLTLRACREGGDLVVRIIDDGRGLDRRRLHEKALRLGIPVGDPEDDALLDVIFLPGFSTKEEVSDLSGRGVGMDVVKSTLASLGGSVRVASEQGRGTTISMDIPMSMGVSVALQVVAGGQQYAIPIENVLETVKTPAGDVHDFGAVQGIHYRGEILPVARLERLLHRETAPAPAAAGDEELPVVVLAGARGKYGLIIDRLLRNSEIAIKPVPEALASLGFLGGVTILGDGRVLLVLNPEHLMRAFS